MLRELDSRTTQDGDTIALRWNSETDSVELWFEPADGRAAFCVPVRHDRAADAFRHPFAYLPRVERS